MPEKPLNPTPWIINTVHPGSRDAVKEFVKAAQQKGIDGKVEGADQSLIDAVKPAINAAVDLLPAEFSQAVVRADGRFHSHGISIVINIDGAKTLLAIFALMLATMFCSSANAQTFGGGVNVTGNTNAQLIVNGAGLTNTAYSTIPVKTLNVSNITSTNETLIGYYCFQVPTNYPLMPGTTNVYVISALTNSFANGTNGGTWSTNIPFANSLPINLPTWMGISVGIYTNNIYVP